MVSGSSSRYEDKGSNPGGHLGALMGTSALCDEGTHQPVVALDCLHPVTGR